MNMNELDASMKKLAARASHLVTSDSYIDQSTGLLMCSKCGGQRQCRLKSGLIVPCACKCQTESWEQERDRKIQNEHEKYIQALRDDGILDLGLQSKTFESSQETDKLREMLSYVECWDEVQKENLGLLLFGNSGSGKTHAAACIANALIDKGISAGIISLAKLLSIPIEERGAMMEKMTQKSLLVIDDFGTERQSDYAQEMTFNLIDGRLKANKPMIITTNLPLTVFQNTEHKYLMQQRIYQRIKEACQPVRFYEAVFRSDINAKKRAMLSKIIPLKGV